MHALKKLKKDDSGLAVVEATILLPFCILIVFAVYYASVFMCQKANMQANLQNAIIYYKNPQSDTYVSAGTDMAFKREDQLIGAGGSSFNDGDEQVEHLFPYRSFALKFKSADFEKFFRSMVGYMFFDSGDNIKITANTKNFIIYKTIIADAVQTVSPAVSLRSVGFDDRIRITAHAEAVITNGDEFIRNADFAVDLISETKLGEAAGELADKLVEIYNNIKDSLGV